MVTWNVVITVHEGFYRQALEYMKTLGTVHETDYFNVLVLEVADTGKAMETLKDMLAEEPEARHAVAHFVPASQTFFYTSPAEFTEQAKNAVLFRADELAGKKFHVRIKRRGFKKRISSLEEESLLNTLLLETLEKKGTPGIINFSNPDAVVVIETVGQQAGVSLFTREDLARYPFLQVD